MLILSLVLAHSSLAAPQLSADQEKVLKALQSRAGTYQLAQDSEARPCRFELARRSGDSVQFSVSVNQETSEFRNAGDIVGELTETSGGSSLSLFDRAPFIGVNLGARRSFGGGVMVTHIASYSDSSQELSESTSMTGLGGSEEAIQVVRFTSTGFTYDYTIIDRNTLGFTTKTEAYDHCEFVRSAN